MFISETGTATDTTNNKKWSNVTIKVEHETAITLVLPDGQKVIVKYKPHLIAGDKLEIKLPKRCDTTCIKNAEIRPMPRPMPEIQEIQVQLS